MSMEKLIEELEDILESSWNLPLSGGRIIVNADEVRRVLEDLRLKFPKEVIQAKNIVADRTEIIKDAKREAETMVKISEEKIRAMISDSEIVRQAQEMANEILSEARIKSKEMKMAASEYVDDLMKRTDELMAASLSEIRKARQSLRTGNSKSE